MSEYEKALAVWRAAITLANNICVRDSDSINDDDGDLAAVGAAADCAKHVREWIEPGPEFLREMLEESGAKVVDDGSWGKKRQCPCCLGKGYIHVAESLVQTGPEAMEEPPTEPCKYCGGTGTEHKPKDIIEPSMDEQDIAATLNS